MFIVMNDVGCSCRVSVVKLGMGGEQFRVTPRLLASLIRPVFIFSVFLWGFVIWEILVVSGLSGSGDSSSGVSGCIEGSFCGLSIREEQWAGGCRVVSRLPIASPCVWEFISCFSSVSVGVRVLAVTYIK